MGKAPTPINPGLAPFKSNIPQNIDFKSAILPQKAPYSPLPSQNINLSQALSTIPKKDIAQPTQQQNKSKKTEKELRGFLTQKGYKPTEIEDIIKQAIDNGQVEGNIYFNDEIQIKKEMFNQGYSEKDVDSVIENRTKDLLGDVNLNEEEIQMARDMAKQGYDTKAFVDTLNNYREANKQPENLPGLDIGVKLSKGISGLGSKLKFQPGSVTSESKNPFAQSFAPLKEALKFAGNIPGDTLEFIGGMGQIASNPIGTAKDMKELAGGVVEAGLNKLTGQDVYTTKERRQIIKGVEQQLQDNFGSFDKARQTLQNNPIDTLFALQGGVKVTKNFVKNPSTLEKLNKVDEIINPMNIMKAEGKLLGKAIEMPGKGIKKTGEALYKSAFKPNVDEARQILKYKAGLGDKPITTADTALKYGIIGTESKIGTKGLKLSNKLFKEKVSPLLDKSTKEHDINNLFNNIEKKINSKNVGELRKKELLDGLNALKEDYKGIGKTNFSTKSLQIEKSTLDEFTPSKIWKGKEVSQGYNQVKNYLANEMRTQVRKDLGELGLPNARELYKDYSNLQQLEKIGIKGLTEGGLKGGFGTFWSTLYDKFVTPVKTVGGKTLYRTGEGLEFLGPKGIKKVGDFIKSKGYKIKDNTLVPNINENVNTNILDNNKLPSSSSTRINNKLIGSIKPKSNIPIPQTNKKFDRIINKAQKEIKRSKELTGSVQKNTINEIVEKANKHIDNTQNIINALHKKIKTTLPEAKITPKAKIIPKTKIEPIKKADVKSPEDLMKELLKRKEDMKKAGTWQEKGGTIQQSQEQVSKIRKRKD